MSTDNTPPNGNIDKIVEHISHLLRMLIDREGTTAHLHGFINICLNLTNTFRDDLRTTCPLNVCLVTLMARATSTAVEQTNPFPCCNQFFSDQTSCNGLRLWILGGPGNWSIPSLYDNDFCYDYDYQIAANNTNATIYCTNTSMSNWDETWKSIFITVLSIFMCVGLTGYAILTAIALNYRKRWKCGNLVLMFILNTCEVVTPLVLIPLSITEFLSPATYGRYRWLAQEVAVYLTTSLSSLTMLIFASGSLLRVMQYQIKCPSSVAYKLSAAAIVTTVIATVTRSVLFVTQPHLQTQAQNLFTETLILLSTFGVAALLCCAYVLYYDAIISHCTPTGTDNTLKKDELQTPEKQSNYHNYAASQRTLRENQRTKSQLPPLQENAGPTVHRQDQFSGSSSSSQIRMSPFTNSVDPQLNKQQNIYDGIVPDTNDRNNGLCTTRIKSVEKTDIVNAQTTLTLILAIAIGNLPPLLNDHIHSTRKDSLGHSHNQYHILLWCFAHVIRCLHPWIVIAQHCSICKDLYKDLRKMCRHKVEHQDPG